MGTKQLIGALGEDFVAKYLVARNYEILDRNWRIREGELDLVAISEHGIVVFVEVKTRTNSAFGHPLEAITRDKAYRLQRLALAWLTVHHRWGFEYRIDAAEIFRPVMAVPGPINAPTSEGCHRLIVERVAELVCSVSEIMELVKPISIK